MFTICKMKNIIIVGENGLCIIPATDYQPISQGGHYGGRGPPDSARSRPSAPPSHSPGGQAGMSPQDQEKVGV